MVFAMYLTTTVSSSYSAVTNFSFVLPFNDTEVAIYISIVSLLFVVGVFGNLLTIIAVMTSPLIKSPWYQLITSLAFSDLISALTSPLYAHSRAWGFEKWNWTQPLCKLSWGLDFLTSCVTAMHVAWFAFLRFMSLQRPHQFKSFVEKHGKQSIFGMWIIAFVFGFIPYAIMNGAFYRDRTLSFNSSFWPECGVSLSWVIEFLWYATIAFLLFVYIPFVLIFCFSLGIGIKVFIMRKKRNARNDSEEISESEMIRRKKENHIILQLLLIVGAFALGYFPAAVFITFVLGSKFTSDQSYWIWMWRFATITHILLRVSECINPVFYNLSSSEMLKETLATLQKIRRVLICKKENQVQVRKSDEASGNNTNETQL